MTEATPGSSRGDETLIPDIAAKHGNAVGEAIANLTAETAVGQVLLLDYDTATLAVHDYYREQAGGLARGMFLFSGPPPSNGEADFVLMRVAGARRLANQAATDEARLTAARESIGSEIWSDKLATWVKDEIALGGVQARILGTLTWETDGSLRFAEDIANYYSARGAYVWKPTHALLESIVNLAHRGNSLDLSGLGISSGAAVRVRVAETRFAAADRLGGNGATVPVRIDPTDLLKRRTAFFGMSRSGKSNAMKITAQAVYLLRRKRPEFRVGQLIFDPNGEYAQDNPQDGRGLHRIHELVERPRAGEVETYGRYPTPTDPDRKITKINFFGNLVPPNRRIDRAFVEQALEQLVVGRELIHERMADEGARYTTNFRDADLSIPASLNDRGPATRYHRAVVVHQTALAAAGFEPPHAPAVSGLFGQKLIRALRSDENAGSDNASKYRRAGDVLDQASPSWDGLRTAFEALDRFINDRKSAYGSFEEEYTRNSTSGEEWADSRLKAVLSIFRTPNGVLTFQDLRNQHSSSTASDYADDIVEDLKHGKLVVFDQSIGDPELNRRAAERIMWKVFREQQRLFTSGEDRPPWERHVLVYVEEAHNLLPRSGSRDVLSTVWARAAKEGGKMNLGVVLATQAPSSVLPEILSETDNWFISHLNSDNEARVVERYLDFSDFIPQIRRVSEPGFIRLRTLSSGYTVPVQLDRFRLPDAPSRPSDDTGPTD
ncbi:MAG: DUF87 domain-containing protein [Gemmatimonadetes bacterium]|nr:DUF87 domain-containing protein [Gemmatimonadota bacterium]MYA12018.1 DUF87 domain-containing protein [Gemmatimonadota bacterium]MYE68487.1 DUF87 domain-containing protein [Gemmatimonadota bacterium]MYJ68161.1 DUF87 domain-containing protein [Gemmatimonadota bacterium]